MLPKFFVSTLLSIYQSIDLLFIEGDKWGSKQNIGSFQYFFVNNIVGTCTKNK